MHLHAAIATAFLAVAASAQLAQAEQINSVVASRHHQVDAILSKWKAGETPGCAVGISVNEVLDYAKGFGTADLSSATPITPGTFFHAASISKQFTAFSIGLLEERSKLSHDDSIRKYIPEFADYADSITISDLIRHHRDKFVAVIDLVASGRADGVRDPSLPTDLNERSSE